MALSTTNAIGWKARDFALKGIDGKTYSLSHVRGPKGTLVVFICNHCPYVKASIDPLSSHPISSKPPSMVGFRTAWALPVSPTYLPNGRGNARCSAFHPTDPAFEPSLHQHKPGETRFWAAETKAPKGPLKSNLQIAETKHVHESPPVRGYSHRTGKSLFA
jgi:hypothetical protein